ncbi:hypothetical protein SNE25_04060 [Mucilaginibacter sabulilitoris]|uniref:Uncharacterized protein n=1 Tax=Mucilaginibacter sabulilitoris TaxID=1173583 RepID=A0ABZ0TNM5_9SPHI|nr:hypothetical protein [Mucilaginibacter sabulilitoris]WPU94693.1 hypothetical protein SNE25_04060 [Mucilaginibacter sabulilitoris]
MKITDLEGKEIEVTNLTLALMQADDYRHYRVRNPTKNDEFRYRYWEDIYQKLLNLDGQIKTAKR